MEYQAESTMVNLCTLLQVSVCSTWTLKTIWCQLQYRYMSHKRNHLLCVYWIKFRPVTSVLCQIRNGIIFVHCAAASEAVWAEPHLSAQWPGDRLAARKDVYQKRGWTWSPSCPSPLEDSLSDRSLHCGHSAQLPSHPSHLQGTKHRMKVSLFSEKKNLSFPEVLKIYSPY